MALVAALVCSGGQRAAGKTLFRPLPAVTGASSTWWDGDIPSSPTSDCAYLNGGYTVRFSGTDNYSVYEVDVGQTNTPNGSTGGTATLNVSGGSLWIGSGNFNVGASRGAAVNQSGGTITVANTMYLGQYYVASGDSLNYNLSGTGELGVGGLMEIGYLTQASGVSGANATFAKADRASVTVGQNLVIGSVNPNGRQQLHVHLQLGRWNAQPPGQRAR